MLGLKPIKLLPARERVASALRKAIISKSIPEGAELTLKNTGLRQCLSRHLSNPGSRPIGRDHN